MAMLEERRIRVPSATRPRRKRVPQSGNYYVVTNHAVRPEPTAVAKMRQASLAWAEVVTSMH